MNVGIIGTGSVGGTLGARWAQGGHAVVFGTREPQSDKLLELLSKAGARARAASVQEAVDASDVILLATPWEAMQEILDGTKGLAGKILIDAINPLLPKLAGLSLGTTTSAAEQIAQWAPGAKVVKAINTVGYNIMENPDFGPGRKVAMFYCGDDKAAKQTVHSLVEELGFEGLDAGPLTQARLLEPFAMLWISLAYPAGFGREIAFQLLRR